MLVILVFLTRITVDISEGLLPKYFVSLLLPFILIRGLKVDNDTCSLCVVSCWPEYHSTVWWSTRRRWGLTFRCRGAWSHVPASECCPLTASSPGVDCCWTHTHWTSTKTTQGEASRQNNYTSDVMPQVCLLWGFLPHFCKLSETIFSCTLNLLIHIITVPSLA